MSETSKEPVQPGTKESLKEPYKTPLVCILGGLILFYCLMLLAGTEEKFKEEALAFVSESFGRYSLILSAVTSILANALFLFVNDGSKRVRIVRQATQDISLGIGVAFVVLAFLQQGIKGLQVGLVALLVVGPLVLNWLCNHFKPKNIKRKSQQSKRVITAFLIPIFLLGLFGTFMYADKVSLYGAGYKAKWSASLSKHCKSGAVHKHVCTFIYTATEYNGN